MRAAQITRFGGPEVLDVVDVPEPVAGPGRPVEFARRLKTRTCVKGRQVWPRRLHERLGPLWLSRKAVSQIVDFDEQP